MNKNAKKWVRTLRSGKYKQTKNWLTRVDENGSPICHCCLGVACELAIKSGVNLIVRNRDGYREYDGISGVLPPEVMDWLGIRDAEGDYGPTKYTKNSLAKLNDNGKSFKQIARTIEQNAEKIFYLKESLKDVRK